MSGPPPKRDGQRRRRNKTVPAQNAVSDGVTRGYALDGEHSVLGLRMWEALRVSGQAQFYEESDWAVAEMLVTAVDAFARRPSAMMLAAINSMSSSLLLTEGDRRRSKLELERSVPEEEAEDDVSELSEFRARLAG